MAFFTGRCSGLVIAVFIPLAIIDTSSVLAGLIIGVLAAWHGAGYWSLVLAQTGSSAATVMLVWAFTSWRPARPAYEPGVRPLLRFGANLMGSNLATYFSMSADNMLVGAVNGDVALGLYDRSYNLVVKPLTQLMAPVSRVAVPTLSRLAGSPERLMAEARPGSGRVGRGIVCFECRVDPKMVGAR